MMIWWGDDTVASGNCMHAQRALGYFLSARVRWRAFSANKHAFVFCQWILRAWYVFLGLNLAWTWRGPGLNLAWTWPGPGRDLAWTWPGHGLDLAWTWPWKIEVWLKWKFRPWRSILSKNHQSWSYPRVFLATLKFGKIIKNCTVKKLFSAVP